jgi:hypothetical protein
MATAVLLARVVVPLWILGGAIAKLQGGSPSDLPVSLVTWAGRAGIDLLFVLRFGVAVELTVVTIALLVPPLARLVGLAMLGAFLPVLVGDVIMGASTCGCFGSVQLHPGVTLAIDLGLFLSLWLVGRGVPALALGPTLPALRTVIAGLLMLAAFTVAFTVIGPSSTLPVNDAPSNTAPALPASGYYLPDYTQWIGARWDDLDIAQWCTGLPADLDNGPQLVLFYRKDCEHCHELMEVYFVGELAIPTTAVAIPERGGFPAIELPFSCDECRLAELPAGIDWFLKTPVLVRLDDGVVTCASETSVDDPTCLGP